MAQEAAKTCEICASAPGSCYCLDCEQWFCENCKILHSRQKISANHEFKKALDFIPEVKSKCVDHNEAFSFVCIDCDVPVCGYCVTEKHNGHKLSQLKDAIPQLKTKIENEFSIKFIQTSENVSKLEQRLSSFNGQIETVIKSITEEGNKIKFVVDQFTANKTAPLQEQARKESERLAAILSDHKTALIKAYALDDRKKRIGEESRIDGTLVNMLKSLQDDIDKLKVCPLPEFPSVTYTTKVVNESDISQLLGTYQLCETKIGTERKCKIIPEATPIEMKGIIFKCRQCRKQKIMDHKTHYNMHSFYCCYKQMTQIVNVFG